jgi:hypothetical protein
MSTATATRAPNARARTTPPGTGHLHQALEDARDRGALASFCRANVCTPEEVSIDGKRLHMPRVLDLMRSRGYAISAPVRNQHQAKKGFTCWLVDVTLPGPGLSLKLGFYTPNGN